MCIRDRVRAINPRQRIGLLVGPPAFVQELGGKRKKVESVRAALPSAAEENLSELVPSPHVSSPQWQEMIHRLVSDWYVHQNALLGLSLIHISHPPHISKCDFITAPSRAADLLFDSLQLRSVLLGELYSQFHQAARL